MKEWCRSPYLPKILYTIIYIGKQTSPNRRNSESRSKQAEVSITSGWGEARQQSTIKLSQLHTQMNTHRYSQSDDRVFYRQLGVSDQAGHGTNWTAGTKLATCLFLEAI